MYKIGLIGCGFMGRMHSEVYGVLENASLVAACDKNIEVAKREAAAHQGARSYDSLDRLLSDPEVDVVDICLPTDLHADYTIAALNAGKHVVCEKPMALNEADADRMIEAAERNGRRLMIGHCIRFWPEYEHLEGLVKNRSLGRLLSLNMTRCGPFPTWSADQWLTDERRTGGGALDMHIHDTDYALYLLGKPDSVHSAGTIDKHGVSQICTTFRFGDTVVLAEGGWNLPGGAPFKMSFRAVFEDGAAIWDGGPLTVYQEGKEHVPSLTSMKSKQKGGNIGDLGGYYYELKYFYDRLASGEPLDRITPASSRASLAVTLDEIRQVKEARLAAQIH